jgi:hypothetical protein
MSAKWPLTCSWAVLFTSADKLGIIVVFMLFFKELIVFQLFNQIYIVVILWLDINSGEHCFILRLDINSGEHCFILRLDINSGEHCFILRLDINSGEHCFILRFTVY